MADLDKRRLQVLDLFRVLFLIKKLQVMDLQCVRVVMADLDKWRLKVMDLFRDLINERPSQNSVSLIRTLKISITCNLQ